MLGTLNDAQIEKLLTSNFIGRIGCHAFGKTYVLPVSYAYKDDCVYVHAYEEERYEALRILTSRQFSGVASKTVQLGNLWPFAPVDISRIDGIVFRILLSEKTGRFENADAQPK